MATRPDVRKGRRYYECHITMMGDPEVVKAAVERHGWKYSRIDGDPVMGPGVKQYATRHYNERMGHDTVLTVLLETASRIGSVPGIEITRRKTELVLFDDRSSKVQPCNGGCPECHLDDLVGHKANLIITDGLDG